MVSLLLVALGLVATWIEGSGTIRDWDPISFVAIFQVGHFFTVAHYLDKYALRALEDFRPALKVDDGDIPKLTRLISTLPAGRTLVLTVAFVMLGGTLILVPLVTGQSFGSGFEVILTPFGMVAILVMLLLWLANGFSYTTLSTKRMR